MVKEEPADAATFDGETDEIPMIAIYAVAAFTALVVGAIIFREKIIALFAALLGKKPPGVPVMMPDAIVRYV